MINLENMHFVDFILYNNITMHGAKKQIKGVTWIIFNKRYRINVRIIISHYIITNIIIIIIYRTFYRFWIL